MININLINKIEKSQNGDIDATLFILNKFKFNINKISNKLNYDCAESDLVIYILELIKNIDLHRLKNKSDGGLVKYIDTSLKRKSINLYKSNLKYDNETTEYNDYINSITTFLDTDHLELFSVLNCLTDIQKKIIIDKYINNLTDTEIACKLCISRQSIYSNKVKALNILKKYYL